MKKSTYYISEDVDRSLKSMAHDERVAKAKKDQRSGQKLALYPICFFAISNGSIWAWSFFRYQIPMDLANKVLVGSTVICTVLFLFWFNHVLHLMSKKD
jgi:hypothetical protein